MQISNADTMASATAKTRIIASSKSSNVICEDRVGEAVISGVSEGSGGNVGGKVILLSGEDDGGLGVGEIPGIVMVCVLLQSLATSNAMAGS